MERGNFHPVELLRNFTGSRGHSRKWPQIWKVNHLKVP